MEYLEIIGGNVLSGSVRVSGAKNAVLPMLLASLLTKERCEFTNVPNIADVTIIQHLLEHLGGEVEYLGKSFVTTTPEITATDTSYSLVKALRASFWVLGPLLARKGAAKIALPGGDIIGARPVDMHISALQEMGAEITVKHGVVNATAPNGLHSANIELRFPSVGATHQIIMAAALTPGKTVIKGAAREPEVVALSRMINAMGGSITGIGESEIVIEGKSELHGGSFEIIGDRIEAGTYLLCAAATKGKLKVEGIEPEFLGEFIPILKKVGLVLETGKDYVEVVDSTKKLSGVDVVTAPFPALATDLQAPLMAFLSLIGGEKSTIEEGVYEGRFGHVSELCRMGAQISIDGRIANIDGVDKVTGASVEAFDIRAAAALVIMGLRASGTTRIFEPQHIRRGYDALDKKLNAVGANIRYKLENEEEYELSGC